MTRKEMMARFKDLVAADDRPKGWNRLSNDALAEAIAKAEADVEATADQHGDEAAAGAEAPPADDKTETPPASDGDGETKKRTIKEIVCELLMETVAHDEDGRRVGRPYKNGDESVLERAKQNGATERTSYACVTWYAGAIRTQKKGYEAYNPTELPRIRPATTEAMQKFVDAEAKRKTETES